MIDINQFSNKEEILQAKLQKALEDIFEKGKRATIGEIRDWNGAKWRKEVEGWVKVNDGEKKTKMDEGETDTKELKETINQRTGGKTKEKLLSIVSNNELNRKARESHTSESLEHSVKAILATKKSKEEKVLDLYNEGLMMHEIVNVMDISLSSTIHYFSEFIRKGKLGESQNSNDTNVVDDKEEAPKTSKNETKKSSNKNEEENPEADLSDLAAWLDEFEPVDYKVAWRTYESMLDQVALGRSKAAFFYGKGGVGKTYTANKRFKEMGLKQGKAAPVTNNEDDEIDNFGEDSIYYKDEQTGAIKINKAKYDYVKFTGGKMTPQKLVKAMQEHNGKILVLDDCDAMLKDPKSDIVGMLKGALNGGENEDVIWDGAKIKSQIGNVSDAKKITKKVNGVEETYYELPTSFKFTGQIVWISNLKKSEVPQPIISRANNVDLTMSRKETMEKIEEVIAPSAQFYDNNGEEFSLENKEAKQYGLDYLKKIMNAIDEDDVNARTFNKIVLDIDTGLAKNKSMREIYEELNQTYIPNLVRRKQ